jgi:hypothetical protein
MVRYVEDIYADYLYDCYIANQRLTEEDWLYYGREEHHIEIPNRDGGLLTPLNSQYLTKHQHWVAGVLQSEMLQKCCFAYVPKNVLHGLFEQLRIKWNTDRLSLEVLANKMPYHERKVNSRSVRVSKKTGKKVVITTPQGQTHEYESIKLACRVYGLHPGHLREVCQGKRNHHKGFTARYAD